MHKTPQKMRKVIFIVVAFNAFCGDLKKMRVLSLSQTNICSLGTAEGAKQRELSGGWTRDNTPRFHTNFRNGDINNVSHFINGFAFNLYRPGFLTAH